MLRLCKLSAVPEIESQELYLLLSFVDYERPEGYWVYKNEEDWMDLSALPVVVDYQNHATYPVKLNDETLELSKISDEDIKYYSKWILSKVEKFITQDKITSLGEFLLSKRTIKNSNSYLTDKGTPIKGNVTSPRIAYCPECGYRLFYGVCWNPECSSGSHSGVVLYKETETEEITNSDSVNEINLNSIMQELASHGFKVD